MSMKFSGIVLKESLRDETILNSLTILKTEEWKVRNASANQPNIWHTTYYQGRAEDALETANLLSRAMHQGQWYTNFSVDDQIYVIFPDKVFTYNKGDEGQRAAVADYGRSINIPESQLDWTE